MVSTAFVEGFRAGSTGRAYENPHCLDTPARQDYRAGYFAGLGGAR